MEQYVRLLEFGIRTSGSRSTLERCHHLTAMFVSTSVVTVVQINGSNIKSIQKRLESLV